MICIVSMETPIREISFILSCKILYCVRGRACQCAVSQPASNMEHKCHICGRLFRDK